MTYKHTKDAVSGTVWFEVGTNGALFGVQELDEEGNDLWANFVEWCARLGMVYLVT